MEKLGNLKVDEKYITFIVSVLKVFVFIYDILTFPFYYYIQKPWLKVKSRKKVRSVPLTNDPAGPYRHVKSLNPLQLSLVGQINTFYELFKKLIPVHGDTVCLGTREIYAEEDELQPNGRVFKKLRMGSYNWHTFKDVLNRVKRFSYGLNLMGQSQEKNVVLFAETREEWIIAALACFRYNIPVVTLYANLGDDALIHGINETEASVVITSGDLLKKFKNILKHTPTVQYVVYMEGLHEEKLEGYPSDVTISSFCDVEKMGELRKSEVSSRPPSSRSDPAIIMYTSGSTGLPKGVIISHGNLLATLTSFSDVITILKTDIYLAYLPLAHVLELTCEFLCILNGVPIGYSSPLTISDKSSKVKKGTQGDSVVLQPTFMAAVPLILDRIYKNVLDVVSEGGSFGKQVFYFAYDYKLKQLREGYSTPILDFLIFRRIRNLLGGNLRVMVTGGAPLSPDTHDFIRVCLCCPLLQGYGLTETSACATVMDVCDNTTGRVGAPMSCCDIQLIDWEEGNYRTTDKPFPRGELVIGGDNVTLGYYKLADKTKEDFFVKDGKRWFCTGDIGEIHHDGCFKIIDRKKDLVKLSFGEYVSLGKVESELKMMNMVENICVYGDSTKTFTIALITPSAKQIELLGYQLGKNGKTFQELCCDPDIEKFVLNNIQAFGKRTKLEKFEIPMRIKLLPENWLPESGLVTAAYKLKRKNIQEKYQKEIDELYSTTSNNL